MGPDFSVKTKLLGLPELDAMDAQALVDHLQACLKRYGVNMNDLDAFCSDGASVMSGRINGVAAKLKMFRKLLLAWHCSAHRLALASKDSISKEEYYIEAELLIKQARACKKIICGVKLTLRL